MGDRVITKEQVLHILDVCYGKALNGIPGSKSCQELADEYLQKSDSPKIAAKKFTNWQVAKCSTSGFVTSLGGLITLPVAIPANLTTVWYVQLRMIATIATMGGYDPSEDTVQTLAYICLAGCSVTKLFREAGIKFGTKLTTNMIKKIPGAVLVKINQKIGFRFITKFGTKGIVNLGKMVPVVGGVIGGGIDFVETKAIAARAYKIFVLNELD